MIEKIKTNCHFCGYLCGLCADVENGRVVALEPDPSRYPYDERILAGCRRWKMNLCVLDGDDRINFPLKRTGKRGEGKWERIAWDDALNEIAQKLTDLKNQYGSGTLASMIGGPHTSFWPLHKFMSLFGSPNNMGIGQICWNPRIWCDAITFGWTIEPDISPETKCILIWGTNPSESDNSVFWRELIRRSKDDATKFIVVDPRYTKTARLADIWVPIKPGTDVTFALSVLHVIIAEKLYDEDFVQTWCYGFDGLREHVKKYPPKLAAEVCGIDEALIYDVARTYAAGPSAIVSGRGIDQIGRNVLPSHQARCAMIAITGNLDRPGGSVILEESDFVPELDLECTYDNFDELSRLSLNTGITNLQSYDGYSKVSEYTKKLKRHLPARYLTSAHPDLALHAMEMGDPYPIRALIVEATNPLLTYADTHRVYNALMGLDLLVVLDYYMTPTAAIADYVLPSAGAIERSTFQAHGGVANMAYGGQKAVDPYYERKSDYEIFRELGCRLGQETEWTDETFEDAIASTLEPTGMSFDEYVETGAYSKSSGYYKHLMLKTDGTPCGFGTNTGKVELESTVLESLGGCGFAYPAENRHLCSEDFIRNHEKDGWTHMDMITGARKQPYNASMYFNNVDFRKFYPAPLVEMSESTALSLGLNEGDTAELATDQGHAFFKVAIDKMRDDLLHVDYGWWHPERDVSDDALGGIFESNVNLLTSCSLDQSEPMIGTWSYNALDCMIRKSDRLLSWDTEFSENSK